METINSVMSTPARLFLSQRRKTIENTNEFYNDPVILNRALGFLINLVWTTCILRSTF